MEVIDLEGKLSTQNFTFPLSVDLWDQINLEVKKFICSGNWINIKYLNDNGDYNSEVSNIPNNVGGIYTFYINPNIIKDNHNFLCYIGRAHKTNSMNLRNRIKCYKDYENAPQKLDRPKLRKLFDYWGRYIYCYYLPIDASIVVCGKSGNDLIDLIEAELINGLLPPCNTRIPNVIISNAKQRAFI